MITIVYIFGSALSDVQSKLKKRYKKKCLLHYFCGKNINKYKRE